MCWYDIPALSIQSAQAYHAYTRCSTGVDCSNGMSGVNNFKFKTAIFAVPMFS
jgi:hypothetical protein